MYEERHAKSVGELVAEQPERARVFERFRIDYCCGGSRSLDQACSEKGVDPELVLHQLQASDEQAPRTSAMDWRNRPISDLVEDIVVTHHGYLRRELPRIAGLMEKVIRAHGANHPELLELARVFRGFVLHIGTHAESEEHELFPRIRQLDGDAPAQWSGSNHLLSELQDEHEEAGRALVAMRRLTKDFEVPADACGTYRVLMNALVELERDMHVHVHKENNILFQRVKGLMMAGAPM